MDTKSEMLLDSTVWQGRVFSDGWQTSPATRDVVEPATGKKLGVIGMADAAAIARAAETARRAQPAWAATPYARRAEIVRSAAVAFADATDDVVGWLVRESGSVVPKAHFEVGITIKALYEAAALPSQPVGQMLASEPGVTSLAKRVPLGVVGVISPFNFPLYLAMRAVAPALALGNAVVLKPDPRTSVCGGFSIARAFERAGLPPGILQVLPGDGEAGEALCLSPDVAMIQFTGSTRAGQKVGETAGRTLKKVSLELGGKNSLVILDDADLDLAVKNATFGAFFHQGQICMATGRILVHAKIARAFVDRLAAHAKLLPVGDPSGGDVALGPIIDRHQIDGIASLVDATVAAGATLVTGGTSEGLFYRPTVIENVRPGMPGFENEVFGPVALITTFGSDDEAVELANATEYGLSLGIISKNVARAMALAERMRTGIVHVNDQTVADDVINPFGGSGASGNGTSIGGGSSLDEFTRWRWITIKGEAPAYPM
jgi:benzaldehyde dehydrogenase (NAD)